MTFKFKSRFVNNTNNDGIINVEVAVSFLMHLNNFCRTTEMPLINYKINLILTLSANCVISKEDRRTTFPITDSELYIPVVTLSTNDNAKPWQQLN